jgi:hypothetical protein
MRGCQLLSADSVIPDHRAIINRTDIAPYRDMILGVWAKVQQMIGEG